MSGTYECPDCDGRVLHLCHPPEYFRRRRLPKFPGLRRLRRVQLPPLEDADREEIRSKLYADAFGGYRPPTTEEAREETGDTGRRKDGTGRITPLGSSADDSSIEELEQ